MSRKMQLEIVSRELIKPNCSSNPKNHPSVHKFSFFDQIIPSFYVPLLFFYNGENDPHKPNLLKLSLSTALSLYYPLAGRINDDYVYADCTDEGALVIEAKIESNLSEILKNPEDEILKLLFPDSLQYKDSKSTGPVVVQVTYFTCGGMSIGLCLCHKLMEMATMSSFISDWTSLARNSGENPEIVRPEFGIGPLYPPLDLPPVKFQAPSEMKDCVSRRLVFGDPKISKLKEMVAGQVPDPTRVEVVASLLYKAAILANAKASSSGSANPSFMNHVMNLRSRVSPIVPERNKGNISGIFRVHVEDKGVDLGYLVKKFREAKTRFSGLCGIMKNNEELCSLILETMRPVSEYFDVEHEVYSCQSWCRYPFYEADFGWGKPVWVATVLWKQKNMMTLIDTKEGGIEAFIMLEKNAMAVFENDKQLLSFCSIDPIVESDPLARPILCFWFLFALFYAFLHVET